MKTIHLYNLSSTDDPRLGNSGDLVAEFDDGEIVNLATSEEEYKNVLGMIPDPQKPSSVTIQETGILLTYEIPERQEYHLMLRETPGGSLFAISLREPGGTEAYSVIAYTLFAGVEYVSYGPTVDRSKPAPEERRKKMLDYLKRTYNIDAPQVVWRKRENALDRQIRIELLEKGDES